MTFDEAVFKTLDQLGPADQDHSGGKAFQCARLKRAGFPVPDGLVVLSTATEADLTMLHAHPWFDTCPVDTLFAVRSSGIDEDSTGGSFAGIHETRLNVGRPDVLEAVMACRASVQSAQALTYRRAKGLPTQAIETGVLIQRMVQPIAAGVAFTINPVTGAPDEIVINSSFGLGEALVSGLVDPDEFYVRKQDHQLMRTRLGEKQPGMEGSASLTDLQVRELAGVLVAIERHYGAPQDVEWCHDGRQFWIVQSRPVTTSPVRATGSEWTRANLVEVLPELTSPQALYAYESLLNRAERRFMGSLMGAESERGPMIKAFYGRLYFNLSQLRHVSMLAGVAPADVYRSMGHAGTIQAADENPSRPRLRDRLARLPDFARILRRHLRIESLVRQHDTRTRTLFARLSSLDAPRLPDQQLWIVIEEWFRDAPDYMEIVLTLGGVLFHETPLRKMCEKVGFPFERLLFPQLATGERSVSAQQAFDLVALADIARRDPAVVRHLTDGPPGIVSARSALRGTAFLAAFDSFLEKYGHRGHYESDWALPRYREDPSPLLLALRGHVQSAPDADILAIQRRQAEDAATAWREFEARLTLLQKLTMLPRARAAVAKIKRYYVLREKCRSDLMRILETIRRLHLVLANRFVERGWLDQPDQYFLLQLHEVGAAINAPSTAGSLRAIAADRAAELDRLGRISMPLLMRESELPGLIRTAGISAASQQDGDLSGVAVSSGVVEGEVVVVTDPGDFGKMKRGAILVTRATDPSWTPLFTLASGVIVEVGGVLSHASTVAREFGLPAIANVKDATRRLKTGDRIRLDATTGVIHRIGTVATVSESEPI